MIFHTSNLHLLDSVGQGKKMCDHVCCILERQAYMHFGQYQASSWDAHFVDTSDIYEVHMSLKGFLLDNFSLYVTSTCTVNLTVSLILVPVRSYTQSLPFSKSTSDTLPSKVHFEHDDAVKT